jgi:biotin carboxyl carrier protein
MLLILEAMKMENALKSPRDGKVKKISANQRQRCGEKSGADRV